jgi:SAM-dependent methyltransferase
MATLVQRYLQPKANEVLTILDIGSYQADKSHPCYKSLLNQPSWKYIGVDILAGPNVDIVLPSPYQFPLTNDYADVIVSGQAFEHIEFFWLSWLEMVRVLKPGGYIFLIAPSRGFEHRYPVDCWRFYADGFRALAKYGNLEMLEVHTDGLLSSQGASSSRFKRIFKLASLWMRFNYYMVTNFWGDTVGVFQKPKS